jgi:hypothetical protein
MKLERLALFHSLVTLGNTLVPRSRIYGLYYWCVRLDIPSWYFAIEAEITLITHGRDIHFTNDICGLGWLYWFKKKHLELSLQLYIVQLLLPWPLERAIMHYISGGLRSQA